jgi:hypothetical protein
LQLSRDVLHGWSEARAFDGGAEIIMAVETETAALVPDETLL